MTRQLISAIALFLVLCAAPVANAQQLTVPNVVGMQESQAVSILNSAGIQHTTNTHPTITKSQNGIVEKQNPTAGQKIAKTSAVALTVYKYLNPADLAGSSTTTSPTVTVPDFRNLTFDAAMTKAISLSLGLSGSNTDTARPELNGKIYDQSPAPGTVVPSKGSRVTVKAWLYKEIALEVHADFIPEQKTYLLLVRGGMPPYDVVVSWNVLPGVKTAPGQKLVTITPLTDTPSLPEWKKYRITNLAPLDATMVVTDAKGRKHDYKLRLTQAYK